MRRAVRRFAVARTGRVLLFAAVDALHLVRRLAAIARASAATPPGTGPISDAGIG